MWRLRSCSTHASRSDALPVRRYFRSSLREFRRRRRHSESIQWLNSASHSMDRMQHKHLFLISYC